MKKFIYSVVEFLYGEASNATIDKRRRIYHFLFWSLYYVCYLLNLGLILYSLGFSLYYILCVSFFYFLNLLIVYYTIVYIVVNFFYKKFEFTIICVILIFIGLPYAHAYEINVIYSLTGELTSGYKNCLQVFSESKLLFIGKGICVGVMVEYVTRLLFPFSLKTLKYIGHLYVIVKSKEKDYLTAEIKFLRGQISPHFIFNALNNVYSSLVQIDDKSATAIISLSRLLRRSLNRNELNTILDEVDFIKDYINIEKLRLPKSANIACEFCDCEIGDFCMIPSMTLATFVENAFKYGYNISTGQIYLFISTRFDKASKTFYFKSINSISKNIGESSKNEIGLSNIRTRLDYYFGEKYSLSMNSDDELFSLELMLKYD